MAPSTSVSGWESSGLPGSIRQALMQLLWGGGWRVLIAEARGSGGGASGTGLDRGALIEGSGLPQTRALNAHFAGAPPACPMTSMAGVCTPLRC